MNTLKQYIFIKPDKLTLEQQYDFYIVNKDLFEFEEMKKEEFFERFKDKEPGDLILNYHMIKYQTTLVDFTIYENKIEGMIVDDNIPYKKRCYKTKLAEDLETGDDVVFIKHMVQWGYYITCTEIKDKINDNIGIRHLNKNT